MLLSCCQRIASMGNLDISWKENAYCESKKRKATINNRNKILRTTAYLLLDSQGWVDRPAPAWLFLSRWHQERHSIHEDTFPLVQGHSRLDHYTVEVQLHHIALPQMPNMNNSAFIQEVIVLLVTKLCTTVLPSAMQIQLQTWFSSVISAKSLISFLVKKKFKNNKNNEQS